MAHIRTQVRDAFAAAVTGLPLVGGRVYVARARPVSVDMTPALVVSIGPDRAGQDTIHPGSITIREIEILCDAVTEALDDVTDTVDDVCVDVERAIALSPTLGGIVKRCAFSSAETFLDDDGTQAAARCRMKFVATVVIAASAPDAPL